MIRCKCLACGKILDAADAAGGTKLPCPGCGRRLLLPPPPAAARYDPPAVASPPAPDPLASDEPEADALSKETMCATLKTEAGRKAAAEQLAAGDEGRKAVADALTIEQLEELLERKKKA